MRLTPEQLQPRTKFPQFVPSNGAAQAAEVGLRRTIYPDGVYTTEPPPSACLLTDMDGQDVFRAGKVGILSARGGSGKTWFLVQLALAVATGRTLLGRFRTKQGRVLLILAEEEEKEVLGRLYWAAQAGGFGEAEHLDALRNITSIPMEGLRTGLTSEESSPEGLPLSAFQRQLEALLAEAMLADDPYSLIILDPLTRFAGMDVETDNASATQFIQVVERLKMAHLGGASVILAHHSNKGTSSKLGKSGKPTNTDSVRGSSALSDGARWVGLLSQVEGESEVSDMVMFSIQKSNYAAKGPVVYLRPMPQFKGALRTCTDDELPSANSKPDDAELTDAILEELKVEPMSQRKNFSIVGGGSKAHRRAWKRLAMSGLIGQLPPKQGGKGGTGLWYVKGAPKSHNVGEE